VAADVKGSPDDEAAIRGVLAAYGTPFDRHDARAVAMLFTENGEIVQRSGIYLRGRPAIEQHLTRLFQGIFKNAGPGPEATVLSFRFLRPDVVITHRTMAPNGAVAALTRTMVITYVLTKEAGKWWIESQNNQEVTASPAPNQKP
jgi:uncharacterized protein (TIGR02246 family)